MSNNFESYKNEIMRVADAIHESVIGMKDDGKIPDDSGLITDALFTVAVTYSQQMIINMKPHDRILWYNNFCEKIKDSLGLNIQGG